MHTVADIVSFIIKHRKDDAFKDWTISSIIDYIEEAIEKKSIGVSEDPITKEIVGIVLARINHSEKLIYVIQALTVNQKSLASLMKLSKSLYPGYKLQGRRYNKIVTYDDHAQTLIERLC